MISARQRKLLHMQCNEAGCQVTWIITASMGPHDYAYNTPGNIGLFQDIY
jgi:hypothetical protein